MRVLLIAVMVGVCRASLQAEHEPEMLGEIEGQNNQQEVQEVDYGVCVPIKCEHNSPPAQCTRLCALKKWLPVCKNQSHDCVCRGPDGQEMSPDEMEPEEKDKEEPYSFAILTFYFRDLMSGLEEGHLDGSEDQSEVEMTGEYQKVNVHEGRLLWDFRFVLGGLLLLMVCLVVYELIMCCRQNAKNKLQMDPFDLYGADKPLEKKEMPMVI